MKTEEKTIKIYKDTRVAGEFIDGVQRNKQYPDSFDIPSDALKEGIAIGSVVKIGIEIDPADGDGPGGERFWVKVMATNHEGIRKVYLGEILNTLVVFDAGPSDLIVFKGRHILAIDEA